MQVDAVEQGSGDLAQIALDDATHAAAIAGGVAVEAGGGHRFITTKSMKHARRPVVIGARTMVTVRSSIGRAGAKFLCLPAKTTLTFRFYVVLQARRWRSQRTNFTTGLTCLSGTSF